MRASLVALALLFAACRPEETPPTVDTDEPVATPTSEADLESLTMGSVPVNPPFAPDLHYYWVRASDLGEVETVVAKAFASDAVVEVSVETPDGERLSTGPKLSSDANRRVRVDVTSGDGTEERTYSVAVLSDGFPERTVEGEPSEGWTFLTTTFKEANGTTRALMILDGNGTPGWWRDVTKSTFDLRVAPDGRLTWMGRTAENPDALQNLVMAADGSIDVALTASEPQAGWSLTQVDEHEWYLLDDGTAIRILNYRVTEDLSPWGGPESQRVEHQMAQHVDLEGNVLFEFSTEGMVPYDDLPPNLVGDMDEIDWEPIHFNSIDVDPADGHWVVSMHRVSMVVKVARTGPQAGEVLWELGGATSDFTFVDDIRFTGWEGFAGQHSVRVTGPDRIKMFDNSRGDGREAGDVRAVEYQLDMDTMEASVVWHHTWTGRGQAFAGGSVQSLDNGHHLVGFGSLTTDANDDRVPTLTEIDANGEEIWNLWLPDESWTYRAWRFEGDPMTMDWIP